jgi:UDP:flavonoid glycosyltransferase YjiC (YdhE family)
MNGVPTVLGGENADKPEVAMRGEHVGVSVNLKTGHPTVEQLRAGIDKVLADPSYKKRAVELRAENEAMDSLTRIEETVLEVSRK